MSIEFRSVTKRFPDGTVAVDDFSLTIPAHEITVFVGPSGCGKTTLLRMINRVIEPSSGTVLIDGEDIADRPAVTLRRSIGYVMQNSGLLSRFSRLQQTTSLHRSSAPSAASVALPSVPASAGVTTAS